MPDKRDIYEPLTGTFNDALTFDRESKTAVSFRDGVLTYLGSELGLEPANKEFTVYRSAATIANAAQLMSGLPLTDEHVSLDEPPAQPVGSVEDSEMIDLFDEAVNSTVGVRNRVTVNDLIRGALDTGKRQLSLGYGADLVPHSRYDFEQKQILPHHLAVVQAGRCGPACAFIDRKPTNEGNDMPQSKKDGQQGSEPAKLIKAFTDAEGAPNLEQIVEIAQALPEALRKLPMDKLNEVMPALQEIVSMAKGADGSDMEGEDGSDMEGEDMEDKKDYMDSARFKDAVQAAVAAEREQLGSVIDKAQSFLDSGYQYAGKSAQDIMRDALATEHGDVKFADEELSVAFKLLKAKGSDLKTFGDGAPDAQTGRFAKQADKEI